MGAPHFEVLIGIVDGFNRDFFTSLSYAPGSFAGFLNGQLVRQDNSDGWSEVDPETGHVLWTVAPRPGDVVQGFYVDTANVSAAEQIVNMKARIKPEVRLFARFSQGDSLRATIKPQRTLRGVIRAESGGD